MHGFGGLDLIILIVYLVGICALGVYQIVKIKSSGDYFVGGRKFNKWLMTMQTLATSTHMDDPVAVAGAAYERGFSGIWYTFIWLFVTPFYWLIAKFVRRTRFITTPDFFRVRYGKSLALLYILAGIAMAPVGGAAVFKATATITEAITNGAVPGWVAVLAMTAVIWAYGIAGGLVATVVTEVVQGLLIIVMSLLVIPFGLKAVGGFAGMHELLSADKFSLHAPSEITIPWIITGWAMGLIGIVAQGHLVEVCGTGKTEMEGRIGFTYGHFVKRFCAMGWALSGVIVLAMVAKNLLPSGLGPREDAFGTAIRVLLPTGFIGLMFAALLATQMAAASGGMVAQSAVITRNLYRDWINPRASDETLLRMGRWVGPLMMLLGAGFSFVVSGVAEVITIGWALGTFLGLSVWFGALWRRANTTGVWMSWTLMVLLWLVLGPIGGKLKLLFDSAPAWLGLYGDKAFLQHLVASYLPAGIVAMVIGSLAAYHEKGKLPALSWTAAIVALWVIAVPISKGFSSVLDASLAMLVIRSVSICLGAGVMAFMFGTVFPHTPDHKRLNDFFMLLKTPVGREDELRKAGVDIIYAGHSEGHPLEMKHPRLVDFGGFFLALAISFIVLLIFYGIARIGA